MSDRRAALIEKIVEIINQAWYDECRLTDGVSAALDLALEEAAEAVAYLRWQEVDPFDGRTLGHAVKAIRAMKAKP